MPKKPSETTTASFATLGLAPAVLEAITEIGYESPSPIQAEAIPHLLQGRDILGQAQTGTGKTAAFALPILSRIDLSLNQPQVLVLAPTRELAIQVSEAFQHYANQLNGFHVVPIYGGQDYRVQLRALQRGVHVVVGTPGRVMDHMRRGSLKMKSLRCLVLDEADEMLRMGFIDDVEWVLEQIPSEHQTALFSATMPKQIQKISKTYLNNPALVKIEVKTTTADTVHQRFWMVSGLHKLDALTRILEVEETDGILIFSRTKSMTVELSEKLAARGFAAEALNGDIPQKMREQLVNKLKSGQLDILVATDVAARGLDVPRISHVINYDIPYDTESYVHRIGRTGRAGRSGEAILFVAPREKRMLHTIERATRQRIEPMDLPTHEQINNRRIQRFKQQITEALINQDHLEFYRDIVDSYRMEHDTPLIELAAALASLSQGDALLPHKVSEEKKGRKSHRETSDRTSAQPTQPHKEKRRESNPPAPGYQRYRIAVGSSHQVDREQVISTIADIAGLFHEDVGTVTIHPEHSLIDLPEGMPRDIFRNLKKSWIRGQRLQMERINAKPTRKPHGSRGKKGDSKSSPADNRTRNKRGAAHKRKKGAR